MKRASLLVLLAAGSIALATPALAADPGGQAPTNRPITAPHVPNQVIVGFSAGAVAADRSAARAQVGVAASEQLSPLARDAELWTLPPGRSVEDAIGMLERNPNVRYVEPNFILQSTAVSNDPFYTGGSLWGMYGDTTSPSNSFGSQAAEAWADGATGKATTYVVVIDEGIQTAHPDLAANIWTNPYETPNDRIDNDRNGYVDDVNGWDFVNNDRTVYDGGSTGSVDKHGTHVSGTIGGVGGNGLGVAGVNWDVTLISAKFLGANGGAISNAVRAADYATDLKTRHGLDIVATSNSWGGGGYSQAMLDAIARGGAKDILFIAAAGNSGTNNDTTPSYPSNYNCQSGVSSFDCVVAVAAIDSSGRLADFSQYGAATVDLGAPGVGVVSTFPPNTYASYSGTSMATPHVSGAAALCASIGSLRGAALRSAILSSTTPTSSLAGITATGGRLDVGKLIPTCGTITPPAPASPPTITSLSVYSGPVGTPVTITGTDLAGATVVSFNGTAATIASNNGTSIATTVPAGATSGAVSVTTPAGTASSGTPFSVEAPQTLATAPTNPRSLSVTQTGFTATWAAPSSLGTGTLLRYEVQVGTSGWVNNGTSLSRTFTNLRKNTTYSWSVRAVTSVGNGAAASVTVRTLR